MNILYLAPYVPDVRAGHAGGVCMGKTVETLKKNHNVYVLTYCNNAYEVKLLFDHPDFQYVKTSRLTFVWSILTHLLMPNLFAVRSDKAFCRLVCKTIEEKKIDVIHAEYTQMGQYVCIKEKYPGIKFNLVSHDVVLQSYERQCRNGSIFSRIWAAVEREKVKRYEKKYLSAADLIFTFNEKDKSLLNEFYGIDHVRLINPYYGIDFTGQNTNVKKENSICFVGQMGRIENHSAAMRLIKIFKQMDISGWKLNVIGAYPKEELLNEESENIHITGFVENINDEILKNKIAVFPLTTGAGIKFKVLLAFGLGLPVITTSVGAEGIDPDGKVLVLAETDDEIKQQMEIFMSNDSYCLEKSSSAVDFVRNNFNWKFTEAVFSEIYG